MNDSGSHESSSRLDDATEAWLVLATAPGLDASRLEGLLERFGQPAVLVSAGARALRAAGAPEKALQHILAPDTARIGPARRWLAREGNVLLPITSTCYPPLLRTIPDPPSALFVSGDPEWLLRPQLAIVGSRNPTPGGRETARAFAAHLSQCGLTVTSGLAVGIDTAAHEGALRGQGGTIAVLGSGPDIVYPAANAPLARRIATEGALVSELAPGTQPAKGTFPQRNRIISGLALGTLVVEAAERSGSLITARLAGEQGREVFAIPGSIHSPLARGCHKLIRQGAKLVETAADVLEELGPLLGPALPSAPQVVAKQPVTAEHALDTDYLRLLEVMGHDPVSIDQLVERAGLTAEAVSSMLLIMELEGRVQAVHGGLYARTA